MNMQSAFRGKVVAMLACCAMLAACGQKEGIHQGRSVGFSGQGTGGGTEVAGDDGFVDDGFADEGFDEGFDDGFDDGASFDDADAGASEVADSTGGGGAASTGGGGGGAGDGGSAAPSGDGGGAPAGQDEGQASAPQESAPQQNGGESQQQQQQQAPTGGDSTGVDDKQIRIGVHAPLTGAAPIPQQSVEKARQQYWDHVGEVHGRKVEVIIRDDQYNPSRATSVCNELIQRQQVFLLAGVGGVDQIAACARTAAQQGVPYISAGTVEGALANLPNYVAVSMSYKQQASLVMRWVRENSPPSNNKFGILRDRTPNFGEVITEMERLAKEAGYEVVTHQFSNAPSAGQWLATNNIEVAFPIMAPSQWVQVVNAPGGNIKQWVGVGPTMGLNSVASVGCPNMREAVFFSSWSGLNQVQRLDNGFNQAGGGDDIMWASWGQNKVMHHVFDAIGRNLTREAFLHYIRNNEIKTGVVPTLRHSANNNFGVNEMHRLHADCSKREFVTPDNGLFVKGS